MMEEHILTTLLECKLASISHITDDDTQIQDATQWCPPKFLFIIQRHENWEPELWVVGEAKLFRNVSPSDTNPFLPHINHQTCSRLVWSWPEGDLKCILQHVISLTYMQNWCSGPRLSLSHPDLACCSYLDSTSIFSLLFFQNKPLPLQK